MRFSDLTTLRVGGPIGELVAPGSQEELIEAVHSADVDRTPMFVLGGGSNLLVSDEGFDGRVVLVYNRGVDIAPDGDTLLVEVQAGEAWDDLVVHTIAEGISGFECLSGIPGSTGATPVQNVGAYGEEVSRTVESVLAFDRRRAQVVRFTNEECGFVYRSSIFKRNSRYVILQVTFRLASDSQSVPIAYAELARTLDVEIGKTAPLADVRDAVLRLRRGKGMVLDPHDVDTFSAGSFFTNPVIAAAAFEALPESAPHWPTGDGRVKVSAAWLIGKAGFERGHRHGGVGISTKHSLAIANVDGGTAAEVVALASEIRAGVDARFGIDLRAEPVLLGFDDLPL